MIVPIGKNDENFKGLIVEGLGFKSKWAPSGKQLLYSVSGSYSDYKPLLWVVDATSSSMGEHRRSLGINTWVDKCTFTGSSIAYCAVPNSLSINSGMQPSLAANTPDSLFRIDLTTGRSTLVAIPEQETTMKNLSVTSDESLLYYTNKKTGFLETIKLK